MARQESFNAYVGRELKNNAFEIGRVSDNVTPPVSCYSNSLLMVTCHHVTVANLHLIQIRLQIQIQSKVRNSYLSDMKSKKSSSYGK